MSSESIDDFYTKVMQVIEADNVDQAVEIILRSGDVYIQLNILSRLVHKFELELNRSRVRAFESANTLIGANSSTRASAAIFALGLVRASTSAGSLYRVFESAITNTSELKIELQDALKFEHEIELELVKLNRNLKLEPELENELSKLISIHTSILRVLEALAA